MRKILTTLLLSIAIFANVASAATFSLFSPATGLLKGNSGTYITSAGTASDVLAMWTGTCNSTTFLRADGTCQAASSSPGGSTTQVQYNSSGAFAGDANFTWNSATRTLNLGSGSSSGATITPVQASGNGAEFVIQGASVGATNNGGILRLQGGSGGSTSGGGGALRLFGGSATDGNGGAVNISGGAGIGTNRNGGSLNLTLGGATGSGTPGSFIVTASTERFRIDGTGAWQLATDPGTSGYVLTSNGAGTPPTWQIGGGGTGTVTSVAMTVPSFLSVSGSPVTTNGTLAVSLSGTALPVANGGTGTTTSTGSGNVVLSASPTLTGTLTAATVAATTVTGDGSGLTSLNGTNIASGTVAVARGGTGVSTSTGSGNVVLSASPTLTGTVTAATIAATSVTVGGNAVCQSTGTNCPSAAKTAFGKVNGSGVCGISNASGLVSPCTRNSTGNYTITHSPALATNTSCVVTVDTGSSTAPAAFSSSNGTTLNVMTQTSAGVPTDTGFSVICMSL